MFLLDQPQMVINLTIDGQTERLRLPLDYTLLPEEERRRVPAVQIRGYYPRELEGISDLMLWGMTFCPGFSLLGDHTATGAGARVGSRIILTTGTSFAVPGAWRNDDNRIECIGGGTSGVVGNHGPKSSGIGGPGGKGGAGGAYAMVANRTLLAGDFIPYQIGVANGTTVTGPTWFQWPAPPPTANPPATCFAAHAVLDAGGKAANSTGDTKFNGGNGGAGASGLNGNGGPGGGGGGGGGCGGPSANGANGNAGALGSHGSVGGAGGTGASGGGVGGGQGAVGGDGKLWTDTVTPTKLAGPGGGGGGGDSGSGGDAGKWPAGNGGSGRSAGAAGLYGAGGGGGGGGGSGAFNSRQVPHYQYIWNADHTNFMTITTYTTETSSSSGGNGGGLGLGKGGVIVISNNPSLL